MTSASRGTSGQAPPPNQPPFLRTDAVAEGLPTAAGLPLRNIAFTALRMLASKSLRALSKFSS